MIRALSLIAGLVLLAGCQPPQGVVKANDSIGAIGSSSAKIATRQEFIVAQAKDLPPSGPRLTIVEQAGLTIADAKDIDKQLQTNRVNESLMAGSINQLTIDKGILQGRIDDEDKRYVGPAGRRAMHWIVGVVVAIYAGAGIASIVLGSISPFGWGMTISKVLTTNLPFMQIFVLLRDLILARQKPPVTSLPTSAAS